MPKNKVFGQAEGGTDIASSYKQSLSLYPTHHLTYKLSHCSRPAKRPTAPHPPHTHRAATQLIILNNPIPPPTPSHSHPTPPKICTDAHPHPTSHFEHTAPGSGMDLLAFAGAVVLLSAWKIALFRKMSAV